MHAFLSNLANRQTDRQTNAGKFFPPLSEVIIHSHCFGHNGIVGFITGGQIIGGRIFRFMTVNDLHAWAVLMSGVHTPK